MNIKNLLRAALLSLPLLAAFVATAEAEQRGVASFYGGKHHGQLMANGKRFDQNAGTVAHRTLPLGSHVCVENLSNGREVCNLTVTDRGPYVRGRIIDVSRGVARRLDMVDDGTTRVEVTLLSLPPRRIRVLSPEGISNRKRHT
jgi:rare lipoprotein A